MDEELEAMNLELESVTRKLQNLDELNKKAAQKGITKEQMLPVLESIELLEKQKRRLEEEIEKRKSLSK